MYLNAALETMLREDAAGVLYVTREVQRDKRKSEEVKKIKDHKSSSQRKSKSGQDSLVDKALDYRPKGTGFDARLDHKRRST
jgi:hypothetical protein